MAKRKKKNDQRKTNLPKNLNNQKKIDENKVTTYTYKENVSIQCIADDLKVNVTKLITILMGLGVMCSANQSIDRETLEIVLDEIGIEIVDEVVTDTSRFDEMVFHDDEKDLQERPPVITIMGHVDHGKTTLLDTIRSSNVTSGEAGGITQHIGAYQIVHGQKKLTFIDTPGHAAFTEMRARGASITDITILVVAADDGVMPQTEEAIEHAKAAKCPIIVAVNKMDKAGVNPDRVKQELTNYGLVPEEWGGDTIFCNISALTGAGIDELIETILLVSEVEQFKANPNRHALGTVIEAKLDKGRGSVATLLIQNGTLETGDIIVCGDTYGRIKTLTNDQGVKVDKAFPSSAVEITGLNEVPKAGDKFVVINDEKKARKIADTRSHNTKLKEKTITKAQSLDELFDHIKDGSTKELKVIIKGDTHGSIEALKNSLLKIEVDGVHVNPIRVSVGSITETDITLAKASEAIVIGFNVRPSVDIRGLAQHEGVEFRLYNIIYNCIEEIEQAMKGMLDPEYEEVVVGTAEVLQIFKASKIGTIAGCRVLTGKIYKDSLIRILRDGVVIFDGKMQSLKHYQDDVKEVKKGQDCGITIIDNNDLKEHDIFEASILQEIERK